MREHRELGREFRKKHMAVLSCSASPGHDPDFERPFKRTAAYLGMGYEGQLSTWTRDGTIAADVRDAIVAFAERLVHRFPMPAGDS